jgi:hypothetical protein
MISLFFGDESNFQNWGLGIERGFTFCEGVAYDCVLLLLIIGLLLFFISCVSTVVQIQKLMILLIDVAWVNHYFF